MGFWRQPAPGTYDMALIIPSRQGTWTSVKCSAGLAPQLRFLRGTATSKVLGSPEWFHSSSSDPVDRHTVCETNRHSYKWRTCRPNGAQSAPFHYRQHTIPASPSYSHGLAHPRVPVPCLLFWPQVDIVQRETCVWHYHFQNLKHQGWCTRASTGREDISLKDP